MEEFQCVLFFSYLVYLDSCVSVARTIVLEMPVDKSHFKRGFTENKGKSVKK